MGRGSPTQPHDRAARRRRQASTPSPAELLARQQLQVYEEELLIQNDSLRSAQADLEAVRDSFVDLYDFAPNGYVTLDPHGVVLQLNLTAAAWLGRSKQAIEGLPLIGFVRKQDRATLIDFLQRCRHAPDGSASVELTLDTADSQRDVQLISRNRSDRRGKLQYFTALVDIGGRKRIAAERARMSEAQAALTSRMIAVQEEERHRISRELHDNIGQQLTALRLTLDAITTRTVRKRDHRLQVARAQEIVHQLDQAVDYIATDLRPAALDLGLEDAIAQFLLSWARMFTVPVDFAADSLDGLLIEPGAKTHLYRIVQEALNNIHKHAAATRVTIRIRRRHEMLQLLIEDDGVGFDPDQIRGRLHAGIGLIGMRERAELAHATLEIRSRMGRGTRISIVVLDAFDKARPKRRRRAALESAPSRGRRSSPVRSRR